MTPPQGRTLQPCSEGGAACRAAGDENTTARRVTRKERPAGLRVAALCLHCPWVPASLVPAFFSGLHPSRPPLPGYLPTWFLLSSLDHVRQVLHVTLGTPGGVCPLSPAFTIPAGVVTLPPHWIPSTAPYMDVTFPGSKFASDKTDKHFSPR